MRATTLLHWETVDVYVCMCRWVGGWVGGRREGEGHAWVCSYMLVCMCMCGKGKSITDCQHFTHQHRNNSIQASDQT